MLEVLDHKISNQTDVFFNPFPGLRPFGLEESHLFFGREGQSDEVVEMLIEAEREILEEMKNQNGQGICAIAQWSDVTKHEDGGRGARMTMMKSKDSNHGNRSPSPSLRSIQNG